MSYQLIYTIRGKIAGAASSAPQVVARTRQMPERMVSLLIDRGNLLCLSVADDALFLYDLAKVEEEVCHVLTSVREGETNGETIVHYLLLRGTEVEQIAQADEHATPAGVFLLLEQQGFWAEQWNKEPVLLEESEARLAGRCSSGENLATWQVFTGDASGARLLQEAPYNEHCLVCVPSGTRSRDALRLLHESDELSRQRGWGASFCVNAGNLQVLRSCRRVVCTAENNQLLTAARQAHVPILEVRPRTPAAASPVEPGKPVEQGNVIMAIPAAPSDASSTPFPSRLFSRYTEDGMLSFMEPGPSTQRKSWDMKLGLVIGLSVLVLAAALALPDLLEKRESPSADRTLSHAELADAPLPTPSSPVQTDAAPASGAAVEALPPSPGSGSPSESSSTVLPADQPGPSALPDPEEIPHEAEEDQEEPDADASAETDEGMGARKIVVMGQALPSGLLPKDKSVVERGVLILHEDFNGQQPQRRVIMLQPGKVTLALRRTGERSMSVTLLQGGKPAQDLPPVNVTEKQGKLAQVTVRDKPAALQLPYVDAQGKLRYAILLPELGARLKATGYSKLPEPVSKLDLPDVSKWYAPENDARHAKLSVLTMLSKQSSEVIPAGKLQLPDFEAPNEVRIVSSSEEYSALALPEDGEKRGVFAWVVTVTRQFDFRKEVALSLRKFFAEPARQRGKKSHADFHHLYMLVQRLAEEEHSNRREDLVDQYFKLFRDEPFARYAHDELLRECAQYVPLNGRENGKLRRYLTVRENARQMLLVLKSRLNEQVREAYENARLQILPERQRLDEQVRKAYKKRHQQDTKRMPVIELRLTKVKLSKRNKLIWTFTLQPRD